MSTTKKFIVTFSTLESVCPPLFFNKYPITVSAVDFEDAQEKAIEHVESLSCKHGEIISIIRSWER